MPSIKAPSLVLVTGATGYIAVWIVKYLLDSGYSVRGTARSVGKGEYLTKLFNKEVKENRFSISVVEDIERVSFYPSY